jgi:ADP-heptose:LPS heptosyltransferase
MHLAAAVGTPVVAVFGPSDPARYAPLGRVDRVVRVDLPCSPCNRIRRPPARCVGHTPDCLVHVTSDQVYSAVVSSLAAARDEPRRQAGHSRA